MSKRYFQWLDGEDRGKVVTLKNIFREGKDTYFEFDDGESCLVDFIAPMANSVGEMKSKRMNKDGKITPAFMIEVSSPSNVWRWEEIRSHGVDLGTGRTEVAPPIEDIIMAKDGTVDSAEGKFNLVAPPNEVQLLPLPTYEDFEGVETERSKPKLVSTESTKQTEEIVVTPAERTTTNHVKVNTLESDPVSILVNKSKKYEKDVDITLTMMLPSKDLFNIVQTNFECGVDKFIDNIIKDLDVSEIVDSIRASLYQAYLGDGAQPHISENVVSDDSKCVIKSEQPDCLVEFDEEGNVIQKLI
jgi:hypothetical protein